MPAYCVVAYCNNSQTTPGITMHEHPRNWPAVRQKWIKFIQFKRAFLQRRITPICVTSTSMSEISQTPWNTAWGFLWSWHDVPVLFQNPAWQAQTDMAVSLWVSQAKYQFCLQSSSWPFCSDSPEWHSRQMVMWFGHRAQVGHFAVTPQSDIVGIWSQDLGIMVTLSVRQKWLFLCIYNPQITVTPASSFSVSFNGNRVKNHPKPWTCPLKRSFRSRQDKTMRKH